LSTLVTKYRDFQPDVIALIGTAEAVTKVLAPLETAWNGGVERPHYVLTDSSKVSDLLNVVKGNEDLRLRLRGTGVTPQSSSIPVFNAFTLTFQSRYGKPANQSGMGQSYDAMYSVAYAMASVAGHAPTGHDIAVGLRSLSNGSTVLDVGSQKILAAFQLLSGGQKITVNGTYGPLEWDSKGDTLGTIEMWCITSGATPAYASSGLTFNTKTQQLLGSYAQCP
jgi:ABC-type branched-subunit amino acid transport system substrate-binding protein